MDFSLQVAEAASWLAGGCSFCRTPRGRKAQPGPQARLASPNQRPLPVCPKCPAPCHLPKGQGSSVQHSVLSRA